MCKETAIYKDQDHHLHHPCLSHGCSKCCYETEMTLSNEDISRISKLGYDDFYYEVDGYLQVKNVGGKCIFLKNDLCKIYPNRPEGCKLYPLVFNLDIDEEPVELHDFCPYRDEFQFPDSMNERLIQVIAIEESEREERINRVGC